MAELPSDLRDWDFRQLFVNGRRAQRARTPNKGCFTTEGELSLAKHASFHYRPGEFNPAWADQPGAEIVILQKWTEMRVPIASVDAATRTITIPQTNRKPLREPGAQYWVENVFQALDTPGEWFLDHGAGIVYYWPLPGEVMAKADVIAPRLGQLVRLEGDALRGSLVHDIHLYGMTLSHAEWELPEIGYLGLQAAFDVPAAVEVVGSEGCVFERCTIEHVGGYAISFSQGSRRDETVACEFQDLGAGGVKIGDPRTPDGVRATGDCVIADTDIHAIGRVYPDAVGIWIGQSARNRVIHNEIFDTYYTGISVGWTWGYGPSECRENMIEGNHIHEIGQGLLSDMGAIYTLGRQPGTRIQSNVVHDISAHNYGGWGIYLDEGSSLIAIQDNIVYSTENGGFHLHYGEKNEVRNNIFALSIEAEIVRTTGERHLGLRFEKNIVYWSQGTLFSGYWGPPQNLVGARFHSTEDEKAHWDGVQYFFDHNVYFKVGGEDFRFGPWTWEQWRARGEDVHSRIANPRFIDPDHDDFHLRSDSPALEMGFRQIDSTHVGPRRQPGAPRQQQPGA